MPGFMNNSCGIEFDDLRRSAFCLSILLCFLMLSIEPQAAGLDHGGRKAAVKWAQTKTDRTQQAPAANKLPATSDKSKASDKKVVYQGIAIELNVNPVHPQKKETGGLRENSPAETVMPNERDAARSKEMGVLRKGGLRR